MDRLKATRVFLTIVEQGSITNAADALDMSTAMVTRNITFLEKWLHVKLFDITTRKVSLTEAGLVALPKCQKLVEKMKAIESFATERHLSPGGKLRIYASTTFCQFFLIDALVEFRERYPDIEISIIAADLPPDITTERIDVSIRIGQFLEPHLIAKHLCSTDIIFCASPEYISLNGNPETPSELEKHKFVMHSLHDVCKLPFSFKGNSVNLQVKAIFTSNEVTVMREAVVGGMGVALLPYACITNELNNGRLVRVAKGVEFGIVDCYATYLSRQHQPQALRIFIEYLQQYFSTRKYIAVP